MRVLGLGTIINLVRLRKTWFVSPSKNSVVEYIQQMLKSRLELWLWPAWQPHCLWHFHQALHLTIWKSGTKYIMRTWHVFYKCQHSLWYIRTCICIYLWLAETYTDHFVLVTVLISALVNCTEIVTGKHQGSTAALPKAKAVVHTHIHILRWVLRHISHLDATTTHKLWIKSFMTCFCTSICSQNSHPHA